MKINLAKSAGFCSGVKRAINIAMAKANSGESVIMLGDIVHNEIVVESLKKMGINKINRLSCGKGKTLLIRAHGSPTNITLRAKKLGYNVIDATCPMVKEIHRIAKGLEKSGFTVIVIGDKRHDEVRGIIGQLDRPALVIDKKESIPFKKIKKIKKAGVVLQSTQKLEQALEITGILKSVIPQVKFCNTICNPTKTKQGEIKKMPLKNEAMVIIGSKTSANTKRLYEISKSLNPDSYWVNSIKEIKPEWFKNISSVGITAGASTPQETIKEVADFLIGI